MTNSSRPLVGQTGLMPILKEWWEELNWPRVLGAARYGLRPGRLGLAFFAVLIAVLLVGLGGAIDSVLVKGGVQWPNCPVWPWQAGADRHEALLGLWRLYISIPKRFFLGAPVTTIVVGPLLLAIVVMIGGAISRITACEVCLGQRLTWTQALGFSVPRWYSFFGAVLGPLVIVWGIAGAMLIAGWALFQLPVLNMVGGLLYGFFLLGGLLCTIILVGYILGHNLMVPAIACEGTDAIDAVQRAYTYFFARPLRLILYLVCGSIGVAVIVAVVAALASWTIGFAAQGAAVWANAQIQPGPPKLTSHGMIWDSTFAALAPLTPLTLSPSDTSAYHGTWSMTATLIRLWTLIPVVLVLAAWFSCGISACTAVYLGMRQICDGQDWAELWIPGLIPGTMAQSLEGRAKVAQEESVASSGPAPEDLDEE